MKAWKLEKGNTELQVFDIDDATREVRRVLALKLRSRMTKAEAERYMEAHYPHVSYRQPEAVEL